ncbi:sigma-70 family RNA polymerase sigma factor [Mucilaginibacter mali]|uniref:Sigma-70 family RNA polymerase sigma factor n=1 Tax=Mucilaginibacter mali TaxID=2740462 RepID=A0A7D4QHD7_9SPHI|nr:sigma-70 family RNA polymerase sigma factor [Mucilaginibacter mali]QKJ28270.1 sigma-70 family RNA polymerase sigma factor [Mucilaginibacter mali]
MDFDDIYKQYAPQIYRVCMGYTNNPDQAKDLVQETFFSVWRNLSSFRNEARVSTWIFRIATNHCLRALEIAKRMPAGEMPYHLAATETTPPDDKLALLYKCIAELPETERIIISLELEDMPQAEIAQVLGLSDVNIRVKVHRIKEKLAKKFKAYGQFE